MFKITTLCLYADDTQIFTSSFDIGVLANNINSDLKDLSEWLTVNKLQFHPLKTKLIVVGSTYNLNTKSGDLSNVISINNNLVSRVTFNKCLAVLLDEKFTFEIHIEYICTKACAGIGILRRIIISCSDLNRSLRKQDSRPDNCCFSLASLARSN